MDPVKIFGLRLNNREYGIPSLEYLSFLFVYILPRSQWKSVPPCNTSWTSIGSSPTRNAPGYSQLLFISVGPPCTHKPSRRHVVMPVSKSYCQPDEALKNVSGDWSQDNTQPTGTLSTYKKNIIDDYNTGGLAVWVHNQGYHYMYFPTKKNF